MTGMVQGLRDFEYTDNDFAQACRLFAKFTGMTMIERKRDLVYSRLIRRLRATNSPSFRRYLKLVENDGTEAERFVNALTTNLTSFFREKPHFPILAEHALAAPANRRYRVWCAAASTGEEPYSIAITLAQSFEAAPAHAEIVATDIDTDVLQRARAGIYDHSQLASIPEETLHRFFLRGTDKNAGRVRVVDALRASIRFEQLNLLAGDWCVRGKFDVVFLRNVLIYFDRPSQLATLERVAACLADGGLLFTGHAESLFYASHLFRSVGPTVYRKA